MSRLSCLFAALTLCASAPALACSAAEATQKAEQLAAKVNEITRDDPDRAEELHEELEQMRLKTSSDELESACEAYDQRMRELDEAADEVDG